MSRNPPQAPDTSCIPPEIAAELGPCADIDSGQTCRKRYRKSSIWCENCVRTEAAVATLRAVADDLFRRAGALEPSDWMPRGAGLALGKAAREYRDAADRIERGET